MKFISKFSRFPSLALLVAGGILCFFPPCVGAEEAEITPTDVYYLAKAIDDSLVSAYELEGMFSKKRIANNLRPRNVYRKALAVAEEFSLIHGNSVYEGGMEKARQVDVNRTRPTDVYALLKLIRDVLVINGTFVEPAGERRAKMPGDVFQMLRQVSAHHYEIAKKKRMLTDWATPRRVYDAVVKNILPVCEHISEEADMPYDSFSFPKQPASGIVPRYVYKLLYHLYLNISQYYMGKGGYDPIDLEEVGDCDDISPADVFDLAQIIAAELKARSGNRTLPPKVAASYARWREGKDKIVPGDVFRLIQHNFILSKRVLEK